MSSEAGCLVLVFIKLILLLCHDDNNYEVATVW